MSAEFGHNFAAKKAVRRALAAQAGRTLRHFGDVHHELEAALRQPRPRVRRHGLLAREEVSLCGRGNAISCVDLGKPCAE